VKFLIDIWNNSFMRSNSHFYYLQKKENKMLVDEIKNGLLGFAKKAEIVVSEVWKNRDRIIAAAKNAPHACLHASEIVLDVISDAAARVHKKTMQCVTCGNSREISTPMPPIDPAA
jgi:hypothetical protein